MLQQMLNAKHILLLLDYDGTLVPFQRNPKDARLDEGTHRLLKRLARRRKISLHFISGRRRADLQRNVAVAHAGYWGMHGWEGARRGRISRSSRRALKDMYSKIQARLSGVPGVRLVDKEAGLALHYRGAPPAAALRARSAVKKVVAQFQPGFRILRGKKIWEVLPPEVEGKGAVARKLSDRAPGGTLAIYIGDDTTDEAAFAQLPEGLTIRVGRRTRTRARFFLRRPRDVKQLLERLEAEALPLKSPHGDPGR
ncbi:MAG: trehalose-phosphatase [Terriglobia bacterium]